LGKSRREIPLIFYQKRQTKENTNIILKISMKMKRFKFSKLWVMAAGLLVTIVLSLLGHGGHEHAVFATAAAVTLTEEEKQGMNENEVKVLLAMKKIAAQMAEDSVKGLVPPEAMKQAIKDMIASGDQEAVKALKADIEKLENALKAQGTELTKLKTTPTSETPVSFEDAWKKNLAAIRKIRETGQGFKRFYFGDVEPDSKDENETKENIVTGLKGFTTKVAGITSIANSTSSTPTQITNPYSPFPYQIPDIVAVRRNPNFALNYVDLGNTSSFVMTWQEEGNSEGDAAITAEGALKILQDKKFTDRITKAKKIAGHVIITEEMEQDAPRTATAVRRLFQENVMRKYDDQVWADIVAIAPGYTSTALDDQIDQADDYAAIGAAFAQLESLNAIPEIVCINPADAWRMKLTKGTDGHYVIPPFAVGDRQFENVKVVKSNKVAAGNFLVAEISKYKVDEYKPFSLRVGWQNDDFVKNQFTIVGEVRFHSYVATNDLVGFCYAAFATVKAQIEKP
jgi:HK97 family phage major capsid protein